VALHNRGSVRTVFSNAMSDSAVPSPVTVTLTPEVATSSLLWPTTFLNNAPTLAFVVTYTATREIPANTLGCSVAFNIMIAAHPSTVV